MTCRACGQECAEFEFRCPHCGQDPQSGGGDFSAAPEAAAAQWPAPPTEDHASPAAEEAPPAALPMQCASCGQAVADWEFRCPSCGGQVVRPAAELSVRGVRSGWSRDTWWKRNWRKVALLLPLLLLLWFVIIPLLRSNKPVRVVLVIDASGSMVSGGKLDAAKDAAKLFVDELESQDHICVMAFDSHTRMVSPMGKVGRRREDIKSEIDRIFLGGSTNIVGAVQRAQQELAEHRAWLVSTQKYAIVLLSDGKDARLIFGPGVAAHELDVRIFTIAYGHDADLASLRVLAEASDGEAYVGTPENLREIYRTIARKY